MDYGVCLPTAIPDLMPGRSVEWAKKAEALGFASIAVADRMSSSRYECLTALAATAAVTTKPRLITTIMISPLYGNPIMLAKQAATVDHISGGRLSLGLAVGAREDDYSLTGVEFHRRGRVLDRQIEAMKAVWRGEHGVGPAPLQTDGPAILLGGSSPQTFRRVAENAGWIAGGGGGVAGFRHGYEQIMDGWTKAGRSGKPRLLAVGHYSLGPNAVADALKLLTSSYGAARAEAMLPSVPTTREAVIEMLSGFEEAGCDEVILTACTQDLDQLDYYAEAVAL